MRNGGRLLVLGLAGLCVVSASAGAVSEGARGTRIVMLGTGTPNADPERSGPSVAVVVNDDSYIVDCGPGVVRRASAASRARAIKALEPQNLKRLFITHLHTDHTLGLADMIFTPWVLERKEPLEVFGPPGTRAMVDHIVKAYAADVDIRLNGLEPANTTGHRVVVREVKPGVAYRDDNVTVKAFAVRHGSWRHSYGYRFDAADRSIVISGDCAPSPSVIDNCDGCDVLVHEVYSHERFATRPPEWQRYHSSFHTSTRELAGIATKARPRLLVLYHQLFWGATDDDLVREVKELYGGRVISARDLEVY